MIDRTRNLAAEGVLIVVSILVAFAIDAWWAERQDRVEERRILGSLKAEFLVNAEKIPSYIESHKRSAESSGALIRAMHEAGPGGTVIFNYVHLAWTIDHNSTDPQRGTLDAILQSGELRYIRNPHIRERLVGWPQLVVDATENEDLLRKTWGPLLSAALVKQADLAPLSGMDPDCWRDDSGEKCALGDISLEYSTEVIGFLLNIRGFSDEAARELAILVEEAGNIVALIDEELGLSK